MNNPEPGRDSQKLAEAEEALVKGGRRELINNAVKFIGGGLLEIPTFIVDFAMSGAGVVWAPLRAAKTFWWAYGLRSATDAKLGPVEQVERNIPILHIRHPFENPEQYLQRKAKEAAHDRFRRAARIGFEGVGFGLLRTVESTKDSVFGKNGFISEVVSTVLPVLSHTLDNFYLTHDPIVENTILVSAGLILSQGLLVIKDTAKLKNYTERLESYRNIPKPSKAKRFGR